MLIKNMTIAVVTVLLLLCVDARAQYNVQSASNTLTVNVARNANIQVSQHMYFGWLVKGASQSILSTSTAGPNTSTSALESGPLAFNITGEGSATITVTAPTSANLYLDDIPTTDPNKIVTLSRGDVLHYNTTGNLPLMQGSSTVLIPSGNTTGTFTFAGTPTIPALNSNRGITGLWIGGTVTVPANVQHGFYAGELTVTISNYSI